MTRGFRLTRCMAETEIQILTSAPCKHLLTAPQILSKLEYCRYALGQALHEKTTLDLVTVMRITAFGYMRMPSKTSESGRFTDSSDRESDQQRGINEES